METTRDESIEIRVCRCGTPLPTRSGGGRQSDYCSRACQAKAYRERAAQKATRDDSAELRIRIEQLTAELDATRHEATALRAQVDTLTAAKSSGSESELADRPSLTAASSRAVSADLPWPLLPVGTAGQVTETESGRWDVVAGGLPVGRIEQQRAAGRVIYAAFLPHGREIWHGGPATALDEAVSWVVSAYCTHAAQLAERANPKAKLLKPRTDGERSVKFGRSIIGKVIPEAVFTGGAGWYAAPGGTILNNDTWSDPQSAADALLTHWLAAHPPTWA